MSNKSSNNLPTIKITSKEHFQALVCLIEMVLTERYQTLLLEQAKK